MNRDEAKKLIFIIVNSYPSFKPLDLSMTVDLWHEMLQDEKYNEVAIALKSYIKSDNSGFAPSIGQLMTELNKLRSVAVGNKKLTEQDAWNQVYKAICNSTYNSEQEFARLPEEVREAVGRPAILKEWANTPIDNIQSVVASNFMRTFRAVQNRRETEERIPKDVLSIIKDASIAIEKQENTALQIETKHEQVVIECKERANMYKVARLIEESGLRRG